MRKHLTIILAFMMTLGTQANAQVSNEYVCNKWSQMGDVETILTPLISTSTPFVLVSDGNTLSFKDVLNNPVIASKLGKHTSEIALYSAVDSYGATSVFYYFHRKINRENGKYEVIQDPDTVKLREVGHSPGYLLSTECFKR